MAYNPFSWPGAGRVEFQKCSEGYSRKCLWEIGLRLCWGPVAAKKAIQNPSKTDPIPIRKRSNTDPECSRTDPQAIQKRLCKGKGKSEKGKSSSF